MIERVKLQRKYGWQLLLISILVFFFGGFAVDFASGDVNNMHIAIMIVLALFVVIAYFILGRIHFVGERLFFLIAVQLAFLGNIVILRLKPDLFIMQSLWMMIAIAIYLAVLFWGRGRYEAIARFKYLCAFGSVFFLLTSVIFGSEIGGSKNWVQIGSISIEPFEFARIFMVAFLAAYLDENREVLMSATQKFMGIELPALRFLVPTVILWLLAMLVLVVQRDLGAALLFFGTAIAMLYIGTGRPLFIGAGLGSFFLGSVVCYKFYTHVQTRVDIWLNPWADPSGRAYQVVQSLFALGSGGFWGEGLSYGMPKLIPEVHTDFIFAAIGEELGFVGAAAVILLYMFLFITAFNTAMKARTSFAALLAAGLATFLAMQTFLIIAGVTKFFPLTGVTMPFISYGGSSMVSTFFLIGILSLISNDAKSEAQIK